jgi:23S rRNA (pseudouridine1915-N3)-methyltransferase
MTKLTVISIGGVKESYLADAINEYEKRLRAYAQVENVVLKEERITDEDDSHKISAALEAEADKILSKIPPDSYKIALCVEGISPDSVKLAELLRQAEDRCGKITMVIGSSHGLSERVKTACDFRLSVSKLTFPHQLMRVILLEAIYRSFSIIAGKKYHK